MLIMINQLVPRMRNELLRAQNGRKRMIIIRFSELSEGERENLLN